MNEELSELSQWVITHGGIGMTAFELYQLLESMQQNGPLVCEFRRQYLRTGTCTFNGIDPQLMNNMAAVWERRFSDGL